MAPNDMRIDCRTPCAARQNETETVTRDGTTHACGVPPQVRFTRCRKTAAGFTLLEIMVAVAIMGGLLVTLIYSLNYHLGIAERHEFVTVASLLARDKLADVEKNPIPQKGNFPDPFSEYLFESTVGQSPYPGIAVVTVTVSRGKESVKLSDLIEEGK